jgi:hypothetical protein
MARSRIIKPEFASDEKLARLSRDSRLTFILMWNCCDDYGVTKAHPAWLKSQIFPYDDITIKKFAEWLGELEKLRRIIPFTVNGEKYYYIPGFVIHQKVDHPSKNRNPEPPREILAKDSRDFRDETETETETETEVNLVPPISPTGMERDKIPPDVEDVRAYCLERKNGISAEAFMAHYKSNGWKVGKNPMKDWKAAVITWEQKRKQEGNGNGHRPTGIAGTAGTNQEGERDWGDYQRDAIITE